MMILNKIRENLLKEAIQSPSLLLELSKLEGYIAETYASRVIIELLQNADDAKSTDFYIRICDKYLICANNGAIFTENDLASICSNAKSTKIRGEGIGYRGIGFKSVIDVSNVIHLFSGEINVTFSKELTKQELKSSYNVPLIRIPHPFKSQNELEIMDYCQKLKANGFKTIFIFENINQEKLINEISSFNEECILFINNVTDVKIIKDDNLFKRYTVTRYLEDSFTKNNIEIVYKENRYNEAWRIYKHNFFSIAINEVDNKVAPLKHENSFVHAFLPSNDITGIACRLNGDFSTDPSRTRIVVDEKTKSLIHHITEYVKNICTSKLNNHELLELLSVFSPQDTISLLGFKKSNFSTLFVSDLIEKLKIIGERIIVYPNYIKKEDAEILFPHTHNVCTDEIENIKLLLKLIGSKFINYNDIISNANIVNLGEESKKELVSYYSANETSLSLQGFKSPKNIKMFSVSGELYSADELKLRNIDGFHYEEQAVHINKSKSCNLSNFTSSLSSKHQIIDFNWRNAENFANEFFIKEGFIVEDRSKSNLGYDLYIKKDSLEYMIEVKYVSYIGESFILTTNEEAVARLNADKYIVFLLQKNNNGIKYGFIKNPVNNITMNRQCRQWVWDCSNYICTNEY